MLRSSCGGVRFAYPCLSLLAGGSSRFEASSAMAGVCVHSWMARTLPDIPIGRSDANSLSACTAGDIFYFFPLFVGLVVRRLVVGLPPDIYSC